MNLIKLITANLLILCLLLHDIAVYAAEKEKSSVAQQQIQQMTPRLQQEMVTWFNQNKEDPATIKDMLKQSYTQGQHAYIDTLFLELEASKAELPNLVYVSENQYSFEYGKTEYKVQISKNDKDGFKLKFNNKFYQFDHQQSLESIVNKISSLQKTSYIDSFFNVLIPEAHAQFSGEGKIVTIFIGIVLGIVLGGPALLVSGGVGLLVGGGCWVYERINSLFNKDTKQCEEDKNMISINRQLWEQTKTFKKMKGALNVPTDNLSPAEVGELGSAIDFDCQDFMKKYLGFTCKSPSAIQKTCAAVDSYSSCLEGISAIFRGASINQTDRSTVIEKTSPSPKPTSRGRARTE